jgi:hypothetical protein
MTRVRHRVQIGARGFSLYLPLELWVTASSTYVSRTPVVAKGNLAMLTGVEYLRLPQNSDAVLHQLVTALQKAKETKSKWLWGLGGLAVGVFLTSRSRKAEGDNPD